MPTYNAISRTVFILLVIVTGILGSLRSLERVASVRSPDETHLHQLYKNHNLIQEFTSEAQGLSGVGIAVQESAKNKDEVVFVTVKNNTDNAVIFSSSVRVKELGRISFSPQGQSHGKRYSITLNAGQLTKANTLYIPYQSDTTKDPLSIVTQNGEKKQGSLGLTEYERPTLALTVARWLALPHQRPLWVGIALLGIGLLLRKRITVADPLSLPLIQRGEIQRNILYFIIIIITILIVYWPATQLFFYSDDVPILARTKIMWEQSPLLLFTPQQYQDADPHAAFGFDFWRPISFAIYPLLLHLTLPTSAPMYYFINILLFGILGCLLFWLGNFILRNKSAALLAVAMWAFSSSKLGVVYWWSSVQDILASLFAMASILLYFKGKFRTAAVIYLLALFSKEYVIVTPFIIATIELLNKKQLKQTVYSLSTFSIAAGIFLIINTAMLSNLWMGEENKADTYAFDLRPTSIARNAIIYASASAESQIWPMPIILTKTEQWLSATLELWRAKTSGPYYPGIILIVIWLLSILFLWKHTKTKNSMLLGGIWWILYLGPILLFANDWKIRWLMLSVFGLGIAVAAALLHLRVRKEVFYALSFVALIYGFMNTRNETLTRFYREQSAYTKDAYNQLVNQESRNGPAKRVIFTGITEDQKTSLNAYVIRLYSKNPNADIIYTDTVPAVKEDDDIIINMSGITPYYPESEK